MHEGERLWSVAPSTSPPLRSRIYLYMERLLRKSETKASFFILCHYLYRLPATKSNSKGLGKLNNLKVIMIFIPNV
jgi:hypothetical protein